MTRRFDTIRIDSRTKTKEGYLIAKGRIARTGVQEYMRADGSKQLELRLPEHVRNAGALQSFEGVPIALRHPSGPHGPRNVDAKSFKSDVAGFVRNVQPNDDGVHLDATLQIMDAEAVAAAESGQCAELSCGYDVDLVPVPGGVFRRDDWNDGKEMRVDYLQTNIRGNHVALVEKARGGPTVRLDSLGNQEEKDHMTPEQLQKAIDDAVQAALQKAEKVRADAVQAKDKELDELRGQKAALEAKESERTAQDAKAQTQALAERVAKAIKADARDLAALDNASIMRTALRKLSPELSTEGWSADTLRGAFEVAMRSDAAKSDAASKVAEAVAGARPTADSVKADEEGSSEQAFRDMNKRFDNARSWGRKQS